MYSVMVGHKMTVGKLKRALQEVGVTRVETTEFCQGHTTRWGVAWTLEDSVSFPQSVRPNSRKPKAPFSCAFESDVDTTVEKLQQLMKDLQVCFISFLYNGQRFAELFHKILSCVYVDL